MSYVDLMSNQRWTEADHVQRTEHLVRQIWSREDEAIINRKVSGSLLGQISLTPEDVLNIEKFKQDLESAQLTGIAARADAALLNAALDIEESAVHLSTIPPAPQGDALDPYLQERTEAETHHESLLSAASSEVTDLLSQRQAYRISLNMV